MNAEETWVMDFLANTEALGRIMVAPPGIPPARLAYLQEAVKETLHIPQLIADGEKADRVIEYLDPVATHKNAVAAVERHRPSRSSACWNPGAGEVSALNLAARGTSCARDCAPYCGRAARR